MRLRSFAILCAAASPALIAGGCSFQFVGDGDRFFFGDLERATRQESAPLDLAAGGTLKIDGLDGDVRVRVEAGAAPHVDSKWTAFAKEKEEAQAKLDRSSLKVEKIVGGDHPTLHLSVHTADPPPGSGNLLIMPTPDVDLDLTIPQEVTLVIATRYGAVAVDGPVKGVTIEAPQGDVRVVDAEETRVRSSSGKVTLERIRGRVEVATVYDAVEIDDVEGPSVHATSNSGVIRLRNARVDRVELATSYDDLLLDHVTALDHGLEVSATTSSGAVRADHGGEGRWSLDASYGDVVARDLSGRLEARSHSGAIRIDGFRGDVRARTEYDDLSIDGELHALDAETSSGKIRIVARPGSRVTTPWRIATKYDDVLLDLPAGFDAELDAATSYGDITGDIDVKVASRDDAQARAHVKLGAGGPPIRVETSSGDIRILRR